MARPRVAIVSGSPGDGNVMSQAGAMLDRFEVPWDETVLSAHRAPKALAAWIDNLEPRGIEVVIAGASQAAALPGTVAAHTTLPVIGIPIRGGGALDGLDALLAISQMPPGVPVATVGLDASRNAAVLAVQILAIGDPDLRAKLVQFKDDFETAARAQ
jgi:5-(carboxyamino)imidazole ribonucleotide mutase